MKYVLLNKRDLNKVRIFLDNINKEFLQSKYPRKINPLERYINAPNRRMIIAKENGKIAGYISYRFNFRNNGWIIGIGVSKKYRRKGIGSILFKKAVNDLGKKHNRIVVRTWSTNVKSCSLFEKMGFKKSRTIKNRRVDGSDDVWFYRKNNIVS